MAIDQFKKIKRLIQERGKEEEVSSRTVQSLNWFRRTISTNIKRSFPKEIIKERRIHRRKIIRGEMYLFRYSTPRKREWDMFPLVIALIHVPGGFLGLNLHYLPPEERAILFYRLQRDFTIDSADGLQRIYTTYEKLKASSRYKLYRACIKRYRYNRMRSTLTLIKPNEWKMTVFLPLHRFQNATADEVWSTIKEKRVK